MPAPTDAKRGRTVDSLFCGKATAGQTVHRTVCLDRPFESTRPYPNKNIVPAKRQERYFGLSDRNRYRRETQCFQGFAAFLFATNRKIGFDFRTTKEKAPILCATKIDTA